MNFLDSAKNMEELNGERRPELTRIEHFIPSLRSQINHLSFDGGAGCSAWRAMIGCNPFLRIEQSSLHSTF